MLTMILMTSALIGQGLSFGKVYLFHIILVMAFIKKINLSKLKLFFLQENSLAFLLAYSALSIIWSISCFVGIKDFSYLLMGILFIYLISISNLTSKILIQIITYVTYANLLICVGESLSLFRYPISEFSSIGASFFAKKFYGEILGANVPAGFHSNPNNNALFILMFAPIVLIQLKGWKAILFLIVSTFVIFMASSKLILVAWLLLLIYLLLGTFYKKWGLARTALVFIISFVFMSFLFTQTSGYRAQKYAEIIPSLKNFAVETPRLLLSRLTGEKVEFNYSGINHSLHRRLLYLDGVANVLKDYWLFGKGGGSLEGTFNSQAGVTENLKSPHFYLLEIFAKYGFFFLSVYLLWLTKLLKIGWKRNPFYGISLILFILFSPVMGSAVYFLPKWALYGLLMKVKSEST